MQSKKHKRGFIIIGFLLLLFMVWFLCHRYINNKYPNPNTVTYKLGENFTYQNAELKITDFKVVAHNDFINEFSIDPFDLDMPMNGIEKNAIFKLTVKNNTELPIEINTLELMLLETEGYSTYTDLMGLFRLLNPDKTGYVQLQPGENDTILFPYALYDFSFSKSYFSTLENKTFQIVLSLYPTKTVVHLQ
ncbi:MAG: hypothetical protein RR576_03255 [Oscillospiraceae bacterium]